MVWQNFFDHRWGATKAWDRGNYAPSLGSTWRFQIIFITSCV